MGPNSFWNMNKIKFSFNVLSQKISTETIIFWIGKNVLAWWKIKKINPINIPSLKYTLSLLYCHPCGWFKAFYRRFMILDVDWVRYEGNKRMKHLFVFSLRLSIHLSWNVPDTTWERKVYNKGSLQHIWQLQYIYTIFWNDLLI